MYVAFTVYSHACLSNTAYTFAYTTCELAACSSWDVRLYSGYSSTSEAEGTVQICLSGTWYSACDYYWHCADANVACQQLGLGKASKCNILHTHMLPALHIVLVDLEVGKFAHCLQ